MRSKLSALVGALACLSAAAQAMPAQGNKVTVEGRAQIVKEATGTYVYFNGPSSIAGVVPFDDQSTFPGLARLDGHAVAITGVLNQEQHITLTDPDQIRVLD